jgi:3-keto-5-aminohexanoate cleavage enzyme
MEIEAFDAGFIDNALALHRKGLIPDPLHFDFVLGVPGAMIGTEDRLDFMRSTIPAAATWMVAGVGRYELPLAKAAIERGGHVRVGLEDNLFLSKGVLAKGSWELVRAAADLARESDRSLATPEEARRILSVPMRA